MTARDSGAVPLNPIQGGPAWQLASGKSPTERAINAFGSP
jgi:hypothetical protein